MKISLAIASLLCAFLLLCACGRHAPSTTRTPQPPRFPAVAPALPDSRALQTAAEEADASTAPDNLPSVAVCTQAIAAQSDLAKLATLGSRQANPRLKRIMYYLAQSRAGGADPGEVIDQAQQANGSYGTPRAPLVKASLLRNLKICDGLAMLDPENLALLKRGNAPVVRRGPYTGQIAEVDHIVPHAQAMEIDNELANLEMLPASLNRAKSDKIGERQLAMARKFREAGLISETTMANIQARFVPSGTGKYELQQ